MRVIRELIFFLVAATLWAVPQQISITSANRGTATIPSSPPYSTLGTFHIDWRGTIPASAPTSPAWSQFNQKLWVINDGGAGYVAYASGIPFGNGPYTGVSYFIVDYQDPPAGGGGGYPQVGCPTVNFGQDTVVRVQKWPTIITCETWNVDGSNYQIAKSGSFTSVAGITNSLKIGDATYNQGTMAFFRGYTGNIALGSKPPFGGTGGDLWDFEFNGNLNDSSGHGLTLRPTGTFSYSTAPTYPPACILPPQTTFRAGETMTGLTAQNSFPLDGGETLTYLWQQIPSNLTGLMPSNVQFSDQTELSPTIQGLVAGTYNMQLTVTDAGGQSTTCSMKYGAVPTDANGSVIISNPIHAQILGPMSAIFASPWAAEPAQHIAYGKSLIQKLAGTSPTNFWFVDYWNQALSGTVTVSNGSQIVTGVGTSFTTQFCQGPGNPTIPKNANSTAIVIWYPILNPGGAYPAFNGGTGRRFGTVTSCTDDTHLTAQFPTGASFNWVTSAYVGAGSGLSYSYVETQCGNVAGQGFAPNCVGVWGYSPAPADFYDNVKALYALWYRTGIDDYLVAARTLADRWWSFPSFDKGISFETTNNGNPWANILPPHRTMALTGLYMRNADNPPYDYSPGLRAAVNFLTGTGTPAGTLFLPCFVGPTSQTCGQDVREDGYALGFVAEDYLFNSGPNGVSPNSTQAAIDLAALSRDMTNRWGVCQSTTLGYYPNGICTQVDLINFYYSSWNTGGAKFPVSVTHGSATVTANGGTFSSSKFNSCNSIPCSASNPPNAIWITSTGASIPSYPSQGDGTWYYVVYTSPTTLALTDVTGQTQVDYAGTSKDTGGGTAGFQTITYTQAQVPGLLGFFWQPYMTGILNQAYYYVSQALAASDPTNAANAAVWALNNANAMATIGLNTSRQGGYPTNGPYYAIGITCPGGGSGPMYPAPNACDSGLLGDRELNSETLNVATIALQLNPTSSTALTLGNTMMAAMFAQPGETGFDGTNILGDLINPGFLYTTTSQHKWLGAFWGVGADWSWTSTRLGGLRPPVPRVIQVSLDFQGATQAVLTVVRPDGTSSQVTCTSSPCPVTIDARQGDHLLSIKYLNAANQVWLPSEQTIIKAR